MFVIGLMSGTSADGVDAVLVNASNFELVCANHTPLPSDLRTQILALMANPYTDLRTLGELDHQLGLIYAKAVADLLSKCHIPKDQILAIGCHGQTIFHHPHPPYPFTMQIGNPHIVAKETGITVVSDFRRKDMAYGGQGAPLVPAFHHYFCASNTEKRIILNLGGIANVSILGEQTIGFDIGAANALLDAWNQQHNQTAYDKNGAWARSGNANMALVENMLKDPYFKQSPPKSTGREYFNLEWLANYLQDFDYLSPQDVQASLVELNAQVLADCIQSYAPKTDAIYVCGGGVYNDYQIERMQYHLPSIKITSTQMIGIHPQWMEGIVFAWLAYQRLYDLPNSLPSVTGASQACSLGVVYTA